MIPRGPNPSQASGLHKQMIPTTMRAPARRSGMLQVLEMVAGAMRKSEAISFPLA